MSTRPTLLAFALCAPAASGAPQSAPTARRTEERPATRPASVPSSRPSWSRLEATPFAERQASCVAARPAGADVLVLPFATDAKAWPPRFVAAGRPVGPEDEPWRVVDRILPRVPVHEEYLAQRRALGADG